MSLNNYNQQAIYQEICYDQELSQFIRFLMARRFMNTQNYENFVSIVKR